MSGSHRRVIPREELSEFQRWQFNSLLEHPAAAAIEPAEELIAPEHEQNLEPTEPIVEELAVDEPEAEPAMAMPYPTAEEIEAIHQQAHEEGFQAGLDEGRVVAAAELQQLQALVASLTQTLQDSEAQLAESVLDLGLLVARQMICDELSSDPKKLLAPIRDALSVMPTAASPARLFLSPADIELLQPPLSLELPSDVWRIQVDENMISGSCRIETPATQLAFSLASRWNGYLKVLQRSQRTDLAWEQYPDDPLAEVEVIAADPVAAITPNRVAE